MSGELHFSVAASALKFDRRQLKTVVAWDKDSTLFDTTDRQWMAAEVRAGKATWEDYAMACESDTPFPGAVQLMRLLAPHHLQYVLTAAHENARDKVLRQFMKHDLPVDRLIMRERFDNTDGALLKVRWIKGLREEGLNVILYVEDYPPTAETIAALAEVPVLTLNPCYPPEVEAAQKIRGGNV